MKICGRVDTQLDCNRNQKLLGNHWCNFRHFCKVAESRNAGSDCLLMVVFGHNFMMQLDAYISSAYNNHDIFSWIGNPVFQ